MDSLRTGRPVVSGQYTLVPIKRLVIHAEKGSTSFRFAIHKEPHAIIICGTQDIHAFDLQTNNVSLEHLIQTVPDLGAILTTLTSASKGKA